MGTRGYYIFKYNGMHYIFYNHFDSYFSGLGQMIVNDLKKLIENDKNWIETIKKLLDKIHFLDMEIWGETQFKTILESLERAEHYTYHTSINQPMGSVFIEYIYIIDMDSMKFKVIPTNNGDYNTKIFTLASIPNNWEQLCMIESENCKEQSEYYKFNNYPIQDDKYNKIIQMMSSMMDRIERIEKLVGK
jgi:hypothetical protein